MGRLPWARADTGPTRKRADRVWWKQVSEAMRGASALLLFSTASALGTEARRESGHVLCDTVQTNKLSADPEKGEEGKRDWVDSCHFGSCSSLICESFDVRCLRLFIAAVLAPAMLRMQRLKTG